MKIGDIVPQLNMDLQRKIEDILNRNTHRERYWILVTARQDPVMEARIGKPVIRTKYIICPICPPAMLNTLCFEVDNKKGQMSLMRALPLDMPIPECFLEKDKGSELILENARGMPIVH